MNLNYMKNDAVAQLRENMMNNIKYYKTGQAWINSYLTDVFGMEKWYLESRITFNKVQLEIVDGNIREISKTDANNAKLIHSSLRSLTPAQAVDPRIWTYLTHAVYPEYMSARWLNQKEEVSKGTLERFFANNNREIIRNGIARLWWYGYLTYDPTRDDPYELTDFLLSNQNIAQALLERNLGNNKEWLKNMLDVLMKFKDEFPNVMHSVNIKALAKHINFTGGVIVLDCLSEEATKHFFFEWMKKKSLVQKITQ
jgi:hypothetical protein